MWRTKPPPRLLHPSWLLPLRPNWLRSCLSRGARPLYVLLQLLPVLLLQTRMRAEVPYPLTDKWPVSCRKSFDRKDKIGDSWPANINWRNWSREWTCRVNNRWALMSLRIAGSARATSSFSEVYPLYGISLGLCSWTFILFFYDYELSYATISHAFVHGLYFFGVSTWWMPCSWHYCNFVLFFDHVLLCHDVAFLPVLGSQALGLMPPNFFFTSCITIRLLERFQ